MPRLPRNPSLIQYFRESPKAPRVNWTTVAEAAIFAAGVITVFAWLWLG